MGSKRWSSALAGALLGFCIAFGGCGCLVSGFDMAVPMRAVALCCGVCAVVLSVCFAFRLWIPVSCTLALAGGYLWQSRRAERSAEALLNCISRIYDLAYNCGTIRWSGRTLTADDLTLGICLVGGLVALVICLVVCCRRRVYWGLLIALAPLAVCLVVTDTVPETAYLFLLLLGILLLLLTQATRRKSGPQGARLLGLLALPSALALALLFWAVPRESYVSPPQEDISLEAVQTWAQELVEQVKDTPSILPIDVNEVDLRLIGPKSQSRLKIMEVTAAEDGPLYLRGQAFGSYDGTSWTTPQQDWGGDSPENWGADGTWIGEIAITTNSVQDLIYFPYNPGNLEQYGGMVQGRVKNEDGLTSYILIQKQADIGISSNDISPHLSDADEARYLMLPEDTRQAVAEYLLQNLGELTTDMGTQLTQAMAIVALVRGSAVYDLGTRRMPGDAKDFAMWFLEESDTGYCVHFATAATVLLRAAGIPARYVTGYLVDGVAGEPVTVRGADAHAWVEIFLDNVGWIMLEPTPAAAEGQELPAQVPTQSESVQPTMSAEAPKPSQTSDANVTTPQTDPEAQDRQSQPADLSRLWKVLMLAVGVGAAVTGQWRLRLYLRRRDRRRGSPNAQALARWRETVLLSRLLEEVPDKTLFELAQKAKYSQYTITQEELSQFDAYLEAARNRLRQRPLPRRWIDRLIFAAY